MPTTKAAQDALRATDRASRTTAPIKDCCRTVHERRGKAQLPFLTRHWTHHLKPRNLVRRMRLLYGRAYVAATRRRFPTNGEAAKASTLCACRGDAAGVQQAETVEHLLLDCTFYDDARVALRQTLGAAQPPLRLTIANILNPPERTHAEYAKLLTVTTAFITAITRQRAALGLPDLDNCPRHEVVVGAARSANVPVVADVPSSSSFSPPRAAPAQLPLDTG